jgi:energy-converting hydrogenase Eha subunit C
METSLLFIKTELQVKLKTFIPNKIEILGSFLTGIVKEAKFISIAAASVLSKPITTII